MSKPKQQPATRPEWMTAFKFNPPEKLGGLRKFERHYHNAALSLLAKGESPVMIEGMLGDSTIYLCAAIDAGLIESPVAKRNGDAYVIDGIDIIDADADMYGRVVWYGRQVSAAMRKMTEIPFG